MHFLYPTFLYALFLTLIPILIHFLRLRRYKIMPFSNVRFLKAWQTEHRKHSNLRNLLVLLMRVLAMACLIFAFAHPYIPFTEKEEIRRAQTSVVCIYIDNSYSMLAESEGIMLLEIAKANAKEIIHSYPPNTRFQLLNNQIDGEQQRYITSEEILSAIEEIELSSYSRSWEEIEKKAEELKESMYVKSLDFYFLSDFQKSSLQLPYKAASDSSIQNILIPIQGDMGENAGIDSLCLDRPVLRPGQEAVLSVSVKNYSKIEIEKTPLRMYIGKQLVGLTYVDMKAGEKKEQKIPFLVPENEPFLRAKVELSDDPIQFDNTRYFSLPLKKHFLIVHVFSKEPAPAIEKLYSMDSSFRYRAFSLNSIDYSLLLLADFLILDGLDQFPSALQGELNKRFEAGKDVLLIPAAEILKQPSLKKDFEQITNLSVQSYDTNEIKADKIELSSPLFASSFEEKLPAISPIRVFEHYVMRIAHNKAYQAIIKAKNEDIILLQIQKEKAKLYVLAMPLKQSFSDFEKHFSFLVSFLNMAFLSGGEQVLEYTLGQDRPILHQKELGNFSNTKLKHSESDFFALPFFRPYGSEYRMETQGLNLFPANYYLLSDKDTLAVLSFNENNIESEAALYSLAELKLWINTRPGFDARLFDIEKRSLKKELETRETSTKMWKIFLIFALVFLAIEMLLLRYWK